MIKRLKTNKSFAEFTDEYDVSNPTANSSHVHHENLSKYKNKRKIIRDSYGQSTKFLKTSMVATNFQSKC